MRSIPKSNRSTRRAVALALSMALIPAACGSSDGGGESGEAEPTLADEGDGAECAGDTEPNITEPLESGPDSQADEAGSDPNDSSLVGGPVWASKPSSVRGNAVAFPDCIPAESSEDSACWIRRDRIAVVGELEEDRIGSLEPLAESDPPPDEVLNQHQDIGVQLYPSGDPIEDSVALLQEGTLASPVYLLFPTPGRMFFPGTLPVPSEAALPEPNASDDGASVAVIDTGGWDGFDSMIGGATDDPGNQTGKIEAPYTFGHGTFIGDLIYQISGASVTHIRIEEDSNAGNWDESQLDIALRPFADNDDQIPGFDVINMSFGSFPCVADGVRLDPVLTLSALSTYFAEDQFVIAAAGNSGDKRVTIPAAFAVPDPEVWGDAWQSQNDQVSVLDLLTNGGPTVYAVGATLDPIHEEPYSTTGEWVTHWRQGCHDGRFPDGFAIDYPEGPNGEPAVTDVDLEDNVYWCGTSFAAPVLSAEIVCIIRASGKGEGWPDFVRATIADLKGDQQKIVGESGSESGPCA